ncbi:MAG: nucleotidyl transferase AbiEii/AbiGii toxin family protein [Deltaproteobacteria bacterium]|nr:nucleotidyl transferase AbiEii/AbiGii toxin family protein [Deltaproteobacteria bacterium]
MINTESIKAKLLTLAKEDNMTHQLLLNRLGEQRFLARLAQSQWSSHFILKGGSLMYQLLRSARRTRDVDFSLQNISNDMQKLSVIIEEIARKDLQDAFEFLSPKTSILEHPRMPYPGLQIRLDFLFAKMKGSVWMDLALGDEVVPVQQQVQVLRYKETPLIGEDFTLLAYPPEQVFAEKFQPAVLLGKANSRMRDYYDMHRLIEENVLNKNKLKQDIERIFTQRSTPLTQKISLSENDIAHLQVPWKKFVDTNPILDAVKNIELVIRQINDFLQA